MAENKETDDNSSTVGAPTTVSKSTTTTTLTSNSNNDKSKNSKKDKYNGSAHFGSNNKDFRGAQASIGGIVCLKTERLQHKVTFEIFKGTVKTHILSDF